MAIYLIVALAAVVENFFPPAPADLVITLAAFLSVRGTTDAGTVFLVTWVANVGGAAMVYVLARRLGPAFFASRLGRRLLSPEAVVSVERNYLRFGVAGLVVARLLPGFRSFTAPFVGLMRLGWVRALVPIALASAGWYGGLIFLGARLGENWQMVERLLAGLNRGLGIVAGIAAVALVVWLLRRRRRTRSAELREEITQELAAYPGVGERALADPAAAAVAALLLETEAREGALSPEELRTLEDHLRSRWQVGAGRPDVSAAEAILARLEPAERAGLADRLRDAAFGDGALARHEARVTERLRRTLGLLS